jgi:hypothetical protein
VQRKEVEKAGLMYARCGMRRGLDRMFGSRMVLVIDIVGMVEKVKTLRGSSPGSCEVPRLSRVRLA